MVENKDKFDLGQALLEERDKEELKLEVENFL